MCFRWLLCVGIEIDQLYKVCELLSNNSLFVGQLYEDKSLALRARDLILFTTDLQQWIITQQFTARVDLFSRVNKMWLQCIYRMDFHEIHARLRGPNNLRVLNLHQIINRT